MTRYLPTTLIVSCLLAALLLPSLQASRHYVIQIHIYVDKLAFDIWKNDTGKTSEGDMERQIRVVMGKAEDIYKALDHTKWPYLKIRFEITDITFLRRNNEMDFSLYDRQKNVMNYGRKNLQTFAEWASRRPEGFDLAFLFTGYDVTTLYGNQLYSGTIGMGFIGLICSQSSVAFVEVGYGMKYPTTIAHEIGHLLGAYDDGTAKSPAKNCSDRGHLMAPYIPTSKAPATKVPLTKCTISSLYDSLVTKNKGKCLLDDSLDKFINPAQDKTADQVCRELKGNNWAMERGVYNVNNYGDRFCRDFRCVATINGKPQGFSHRSAPNGLKCGKNKRCIWNKCVETSDGDPHMSDNCPWGDQDLRTIGYTKPTFNSCKHLTCNEGWKPYCCVTCVQ